MQTIITATTARRYSQRFYVLPGESAAEKERTARRFAGTGGSIRVTERDRLNDYVGAPIWSAERLVREERI